MRKQPTPWQLRWARWHRPLIVVLFIAMVLTAIFVSLGVAAVLFGVTLGLAAFGGGTPKENGKLAAPSISRMYGQRW